MTLPDDDCGRVNRIVEAEGNFDRDIAQKNLNSDWNDIGSRITGSVIASLVLQLIAEGKPNWAKVRVFDADVS